MSVCWATLHVHEQKERKTCTPDQNMVYYYAHLVLASLVAAFSLVQDSVEGVVASMLISPIGDPLLALAPAVYAGNVHVASSAAWTLAVSVPVMLGIGACVRAWDSSEQVTGEMRKRTEIFKVHNVLAYAMLIGAAMAAQTPNDTAVRATGLAIAIAILPPIVNAGILLFDAVRARARAAGKGGVEARTGAMRSGGLAFVNVAGVLASAFVLTLFVKAKL